jgi:dethiobiotin synthetase
MKLNTKSFFVTGTDTDVGKTYVCNLLLRQLNQQGFEAIGYKPIAAGAELTAHGLRNEDALILQQASAGTPAYESINPICYQQAIAPHIAAMEQGEQITCAQLSHWWRNRINGYQVEVVEGAGGWRLPINDQQWLSEFVIEAKLDVILVVGMKLGCLNHALLTAEAIANDGLNLVGWIANQLAQPMDHYQTNLDYLTAQLSAPLLGAVKSGQVANPSKPLFNLSSIIS